jgi:hypothetical protein
MSRNFSNFFNSNEEYILFMPAPRCFIVWNGGGGGIFTILYSLLHLSSGPVVIIKMMSRSYKGIGVQKKGVRRG